MKKDAILYAVLVPIGLILIVNIVVFTMVIHALTCARKSVTGHVNQSKRKRELLLLMAFISVFVILGLYRVQRVLP